MADASLRRRAWWRQGLIQLLAAVAAWYFIAPASQPAAWAVLQGLLSCLLAFAYRLPGWQKWGHALFMPAVVVMQQAALPAWVYLLGLLLTIAVGRNALVERVPLYRSASEVAHKLAECLPQNARLLEAGCGDGRLALQLARLRPDLHIQALENAWGSWLLAQLRWYCSGRPAQVRMRCHSFWQEDWSGYDAVYAFLSPAPMPRVWSKFMAEGKPGCVLISNTFAIPDTQPDERLPLAGALQKELLIWHTPHGPR